MARFRIIILDQVNSNTNDYRFVMWADVPAARQARYANPSATSAWSGAIAADITALQNGSVVERVAVQRVNTGATLAQIEAFLQSMWTNFQSDITAGNPWIRYGTTWDGTTWVVANNG